METDSSNPASPASQGTELAPLAGIAEDHSVTQRDGKGRFITGNNGGGRPCGARSRLSELALSLVVADFAEHGHEALARLRTADPEAYLRLVLSLVPRELILQNEKKPEIDYAALNDDEITALVKDERRRRFVKVALEHC